MAAAWLTTDGLILNFVMVTTAVANGQIRNAELKAVGPIPRFRIKESRDNLYIDPASYRRYDRYVAAIAALDARGAARCTRRSNRASATHIGGSEVPATISIP